MADIGTDYRSAKDCIAAAYDEAVLLDVRITGHRFAEALLARLAALDPPMLVVALDPPIDDTTPMRDYVTEDEVEAYRPLRQACPDCQGRGWIIDPELMPPDETP